MANRSTESLRAWFHGVEKMVPELYNAGLAMCASPSLAQEAMQEALLEAWSLDVGSGVGYRERLRAALRREALRLNAEAEGESVTWPGLMPAGASDDLMAQAAKESPEAQRLILLRYGCRLSPKAAGALLGMDAAEARQALAGFEGRCRRLMPKEARGRVEAALIRQARRVLLRPMPGMPPVERVYRDFEAGAMGMEASTPRLGRILSRVAVALMALICAVMFWIFAVISAPGAQAAGRFFTR